MNRQCCVEWDGSLLSSKVSPHVLLRATVLVSGFHAIVSRFHVPHFGFLDSGTLVLDSNRGWIPDSLSCIPVPKPRILPFKAKLCCFPNSKSKTFADSGRRRDSRLISREKILQGNTQGKNFLLWKKISLVGYNAGKILTPLYIGEKNSIPNSLNFRRSLRVVFSSQQITHILPQKSNGRRLTKSLVPDYHDYGRTL